jgi:hypothetical protein
MDPGCLYSLRHLSVKRICSDGADQFLKITRGTHASKLGPCRRTPVNVARSFHLETFAKFGVC